ncbi:MAG: Co2+/Mg2+ efflux protein ApaG [Bryobacterales bacterium]|jgi:ApaG protein|nr:Co2+/Mg2+ efflux protein ApaG [Bryobacterales bacterium]
MIDSPLAPAPVSEAITHSIRVEVLSRHATEHSKPGRGEWVFEYTVRITNLGSEQVQLMSRHWIITDAIEQIKEVKGPGVVGKQPVLEPGESFKYSSWCPLPTPLGVMRGTYHMVTADGREFDVEIAPFALRAPYTVH